MGKKTVIERYIPANPPDGKQPGDFLRAIWDEFYRISRSLIGLDQPAAVAMSASEQVSVQVGQVWDRFFNEGITNFYEQPPGYFNQATGVWTAPTEGLYLFSSTITVPAFGSGNKQYFCEVRLTATPIIGVPYVKIETAGGADDVPLQVTSVYLLPLQGGATVTVDVSISHDNQTGTLLVKGNLGIFRTSGLR